MYIYIYIHKPRPGIHAHAKLCFFGSLCHGQICLMAGPMAHLRLLGWSKPGPMFLPLTKKALGQESRHALWCPSALQCPCAFKISLGPFTSQSPKADIVTETKVANYPFWNAHVYIIYIIYLHIYIYITYEYISLWIYTYTHFSINVLYIYIIWCIHIQIYVCVSGPCWVDLSPGTHQNCHPHQGPLAVSLALGHHLQHCPRPFESLQLLPSWGACLHQLQARRNARPWP